MTWTIVLTLGIALLVVHSDAAGSKRIIGGHAVNITDFPYQVSLRFLDKHKCGGSIISEQHILTAAHCINEYMKPPHQNYAYVFTGTSRPVGGELHQIARVDVHPGWVPGGQQNRPHDIAVITLRSKITFNENQQKINLPEHDFEEGATANLTGWGRIEQEVRPKQLQMVETTLISRKDCEAKMPDPAMKIFDTQVCAFHSYGRGPCSGDSGGPLAVNGEVVGIVSFSYSETCASGIPDAYTNVYKYKSFITSVMSKTN